MTNSGAFLDSLTDGSITPDLNRSTSFLTVSSIIGNMDFCACFIGGTFPTTMWWVVRIVYPLTIPGSGRIRLARFRTWVLLNYRDTIAFRMQHFWFHSTLVGKFVPYSILATFPLANRPSTSNMSLRSPITLSFPTCLILVVVGMSLSLNWSATTFPTMIIVASVKGPVTLIAYHNTELIRIFIGYSTHFVLRVSARSDVYPCMFFFQRTIYESARVT